MYKSRLPKWDNNTPQQTETRTTSKSMGRTIEAYTNRLNELLIQNPMDSNRFTVYPDIDSYNHRTVIPESRYRNDIKMDGLASVTIDTEKLIVIHPRGEYPQGSVNQAPITGESVPAYLRLHG